RAVLTAVDIKIETRFLIGIWKPTPISGVMLADAYGTLRERPVIRACLSLQHCSSDLRTV
ncbi:hypothetical protein QHH11_29045, partial [Aphanizomenon sp. PH219]|nr:hypothetical protein [Aphanizomenon sp. PH219]